MKKNILLGTIHILRKQFGIGGPENWNFQYYVYICFNKVEYGQKTAFFCLLSVLHLCLDMGEGGTVC